MKSPMITNPANGIHNPDGYSDLKVIQSGMGYYIGTTYTDEDMNEAPGSLESACFESRHEAEEFLARLVRNS